VNKRHNPHRIGKLVTRGVLPFAAALLLGPAGALAAITSSPASTTPSSIWQVDTSANPGSTTFSNSAFQSVSASGPKEAWSVGRTMNDQALDQPLAEHWNGSSWTSATVPVPAGQQAVLNAVDDLGPSNAWAVGTSFGGGVGATPAGVTLIEHWNGTSWSIVPSPNPAAGVSGDTDVLNAISGTGPSDLWVAGSDLNEATDTISLLFEHWNGTAWTAVASPTPEGSAEFASGITAISPTNVWAVGTDETDGLTDVSAHWNGHAWSIVPTPEITSAHDQNALTGVSSDGPSNVWASGFADNVDGQNLRVPFVLHWNGTRWVLTKVPTLGSEGSMLNGIQVISPTDAWAVGQTQESDGAILNLTEQFDGSSWAIQSSPQPGMLGGLSSNSLDSVTSAGGGDLFAVGERFTPGQEGMRTLAISTTQGMN